MTGLPRGHTLTLLPMRIPLPAGYPVNVRQFLMRCGYASHFDPAVNRLSFVRRLLGGRYPRFHLYIGKAADGQTYFNLHLDQQFGSSRGARAHHAEYGSPLVSREGERLYRLLQAAVAPANVPPERQSWWPWRRRADG